MPVDFSALRDPRWQGLRVALAAPETNFAMALAWGMLGLTLAAAGIDERFLTGMAAAGVGANLAMAALNLVPVPPLDGGRVLAALLPQRLAPVFARVEQYGFYIVMALILTGVLTQVWMRPVAGLLAKALMMVLSPLQAALSWFVSKFFPHMFPERVLSGMRPTGALHLGHYHGVLKNWVRLQAEYPCFFFVADWHALTTHYESPEVIEESVWEMLIDWLAAGVDPTQATLFIQSRVPEHAELFLLLSMGTPLGWLERVPTYKDQIEKLKEKDLSTYGFLGYPLLQAADILIYRAGFVPVGEDQVPHVEMTREVARRFNYLYGREPGFEQKALDAAKKLGGKRAKLYLELRTAHQERGEDDALEQARALLAESQSLSMGDRERLFGYLEGARKIILPEPQVLLTEASRMPGLDGQKMSKSYGNTIRMREDKASVEKKVRTMPTDPARVRRTDPGDPGKCPVWQLHQVYSDADTREWVQKGCRSAGIGCLECKQPVIDGILREQQPMLERAQKYMDDPSLLRAIIADGCDTARKVTQETMREVREAMGLTYS